MKYFVDFEASSLEPDSVPIEVAWVDENGHGEAHLIRPGEGRDNWSIASELVHGISRGCIARDGRDAEWVAARVVEVLAGNETYSDTPSFDGAWLAELLAVLPHPPAIALRLLDVDALYRQEILTLLGREPLPEGERALARRAATVEAVGSRILIRARAEEARRAGAPPGAAGRGELVANLDRHPSARGQCHHLRTGHRSPTH